jgi:CRP/FNR family cyclic AMP-dependent transcriptional regulator
LKDAGRGTADAKHGADEAIAARLARAILFADVPDSDLRALAPCAHVQEFSSGDAILRRGDAADCFFIVDEGSARVSGPGGGDGVLLHEITAGEHFGEVALIDGHPRTADVVAGEAGCRTISIERADFLRIVEAHPRVAGQLVTFLRHGLRQGTTDDYEDIAGRLTRAIDLLARDEGRAAPLVELLPVQLKGGAVWWYRPQGQTSWQTACEPGRFPGDVLLALLEQAGTPAVILHSTSWRYADERLVLTYVAVLPETAAPSGLTCEEVRREDLARGGSDTPPGTIDVGQVVEHGLRHLAWLLNDDPVVRELLSAAWGPALEAYEPEPFRALVRD